MFICKYCGTTRTTVANTLDNGCLHIRCIDCGKMFYVHPKNLDDEIAQARETLDDVERELEELEKNPPPFDPGDHVNCRCYINDNGEDWINVPVDDADDDWLQDFFDDTENYLHTVSGDWLLDLFADIENELGRKIDGK